MNSVFTIEELFSGKVLVVPDYQRGYAWEERQWNDFLNDLEYLGPDKHHYTGTVVLHQQSETVRDEEGRSHKVVHVVDGQQRLTTVVLFLECIRKQIGEFNPTLAAGIRKSYIEFRDLNQQPSYKLRLNSDCHEYFVQNVLADPIGPQGPMIASHKRLKEAKEYFAKYLGAKKIIDEKTFPEWLLQFYEKIVSQLKVSQYIVEQSSEVGVIFEVMNNRGKPLSELEKVKNYLLYLASKLNLDEPNDLADRINATWAEIFQRLMANGLNQSHDENRLLRAHWLMLYDPNAREFSGSSSIKSKYNLKSYDAKHKELLAALTKYTNSLKSAVGPFCEAFAPRHTSAFSIYEPNARTEVRRAAEKLCRVGLVAPFLPMLIACRLKFPDDPGKYLSLLRMCELFAFRVYKVMERRSDAGQAKLFRLGYQLFAGEISFQSLLDSIRQLALRFCSNQELRESCDLDDVDNDWYSWNGLKYMLYEYEAHLAGKHALTVSWEDVERRDLQRSIEHILPQTPDAEYWRQQFTRQQRRRLTHDVGNLCLTENNSVYGNKPFPDKRGQPGVGQCYANANLFQERELAQYDQWNEEALLQRRKKITDWYLLRWHLDDSDLSDLGVDVDEPEADEEESESEQVVAEA